MLSSWQGPWQHIGRHRDEEEEVAERYILICRAISLSLYREENTGTVVGILKSQRPPLVTHFIQQVYKYSNKAIPTNISQTIALFGD